MFRNAGGVFCNLRLWHNAWKIDFDGQKFRFVSSITFFRGSKKLFCLLAWFYCWRPGFIVDAIIVNAVPKARRTAWRTTSVDKMGREGAAAPCRFSTVSSSSFTASLLFHARSRTVVPPPPSVCGRYCRFSKIKSGRMVNPVTAFLFLFQSVLLVGSIVSLQTFFSFFFPFLFCVFACCSFFSGICFYCPNALLFFWITHLMYAYMHSFYLLTGVIASEASLFKSGWVKSNIATATTNRHRSPKNWPVFGPNWVFLPHICFRTLLRSYLRQLDELWAETLQSTILVLQPSKTTAHNSSFTPR